MVSSQFIPPFSGFGKQIQRTQPAPRAASSHKITCAGTSSSNTEVEQSRNRLQRGPSLHLLPLIQASGWRYPREWFWHPHPHPCFAALEFFRPVVPWCPLRCSHPQPQLLPVTQKFGQRGVQSLEGGGRSEVPTTGPETPQHIGTNLRSDERPRSVRTSFGRLFRRVRERTTKIGIRLRQMWGPSSGFPWLLPCAKKADR